MVTAMIILLLVFLNSSFCVLGCVLSPSLGVVLLLDADMRHPASTMLLLSFPFFRSRALLSLARASQPPRRSKCVQSSVCSHSQSPHLRCHHMNFLEPSLLGILSSQSSYFVSPVVQSISSLWSSLIVELRQYTSRIDESFQIDLATAAINNGEHPNEISRY